MLRRSSLTIALFLLWTASAIAQQPLRLNIYHFDVNTGDATLIITPEGRGILIDGGNTGRGINPILEFMNRAKMQAASMHSITRLQRITTRIMSADSMKCSMQPVGIPKWQLSIVEMYSCLRLT